MTTTEEYNGYTIELDHRNPYGKPEYMFYPTSQGVQHDGDYDDGWKYCGNCKWASMLEDAKAEIDDLVEGASCYLDDKRQEAIEQAQEVREVYNQAHNI